MEADTLLELLRACAWAPPGDGDDPGELYKQAVKDLKASQVWRKHQCVRLWLSNIWLSIPMVCIACIFTQVQSNTEHTFLPYALALFLSLQILN